MTTSAMQNHCHCLHSQKIPPGISWASSSAVSTFRTREAVTKIMSILMVTFHRGLTLGYTCYQKASAAFFNAPSIHVLPVGFAMVTPLAKNKSLEASCILVACCEWPSSAWSIRSVYHSSDTYASANAFRQGFILPLFKRSMNRPNRLLEGRSV